MLKYIDTERAFSKEELLYVYRKVKRDLYFEKDNIILEKLVDFENDLHNNIDFLFQLLNTKNNLDNIISEIETGNFTFLYKNIEFNNSKNFSIIAAKTVENFQNDLFGIKSIECRFVGDISIFFQIIGGLWINRIGHQLDEMLSTNVYGCRLEKFDKKSNVKNYKHNTTLFKPYFNDFKSWQNNLFKSIEETNKDIIVITCDLKKYYHTIDLNNLENRIDEVLSNNELSLIEYDFFLNKLMFSLIRKFNQKNNKNYSFYQKFTNLENNKNNNIENIGLPLTLNASKVLANFHLIQFDEDIIKNVRPLYYGRYVDDFIIAIENVSSRKIDLKSIFRGLKNYFINAENEIEHRNVKSIKSSVLGRFNDDKEKIFFFNYEKDKGEIDHLKKSINKNSSEWKLIPDISDYDEIDSSDFFTDSNNDCEEVDSLRKSTGLTIKRNHFVREIVAFENNINFLPNQYWEKRLDNFLNLIFEYIFDFKNFIDLSKYIPRLFGILIHSHDKNICAQYFERLNETFEIFKTIPSNELQYANSFLERKIFECIIGSLPLDYNQNKNFLNKVFEKYLNNRFWMVENEIVHKIRQYFNTDLHRIPYKDCYFKYDEYVKYLDSNLNDWEEQLIEYSFFTQNLIDFVVHNLHSTQCGCLNLNCDVECRTITQSSGFYFYTRSISLLELTVAFKNLIIKDNKNFSMLAEKYYIKINFKSNFNDRNINKEDNDPIFIDFDQNQQDILNLKNPIIATTHFLTEDSSFDSNVRNILDTDLTRYDRIIETVNQVIRCKTTINYLVFHELALPRNLYLQLATKLSYININLVAGLEYKIDRTAKDADNQLVYVINNSETSNSDSIAIFQSKLIGAVHELKEIWNKANLKIEPSFREKLIIKNDGFVFSGLICNDLLYMNNRSQLVTKIDNLFVVAWNQDIETYENLVKSSCLDIHSFVTLCNNRLYGDTRIRAPYKVGYKRDIMKIHGGNLDNFMLTELDIKSLRNFQTNEIPPDQPFKPFPIGFEISPERRLI